MRDANEIGYSMKTSAAGRSRPGRPKYEGEPKGDEIPVMEVLGECPLAAEPIAKRLGWKTKKVADHLRSLRLRNYVVIAGREPTPGNRAKVERHVYRVAA